MDVRQLKRIPFVFVVLALVFGAWWVALPVIKGWTLPAPPLDGWLLRPASVLRFGACTVLSAVTVPFVLRPLTMRWREEDRGRPAPRSRASLVFQASLLFVVYLATGAFYLLGWSSFSPDGISVCTPLGTRSHLYEDVARLLVIPPGYQDGPNKPGPEFAIEFHDERWAYFGLHNEGASVEDVEAIARMVAELSGEAWELNPRARPRP